MPGPVLQLGLWPAGPGVLEGGKKGEPPPPRPPQQLTVDSRNLALHDSSGGRPARYGAH